MWVAPFYLVQRATGQICGHHKRTSWAWWEVLAERREADLRQSSRELPGLLGNSEPAKDAQDRRKSKDVLCA